MLHRLHLVKRSVVALASTAIVLATACSPAPTPVSQSRRDPSSPLAPEGANPLAAVVAKAAPAQVSAGGHEHHHEGHAGHSHAEHAAPAPASEHEGHGSGVGSGADGGTQGTVYVCPMHPEVTSNAPGALCPKCNMKLVPKQ